MKYTINQSSSYQDYMQDGLDNTLLAKVLDFKGIKKDDLAKHINPAFVYHDYALFNDSMKVLDRIRYALDHNQKICVYGDYDCDGILATSILVDAFKQLGFDVGYYIPDRIIDGYGLNVKRVQQMIDKQYNLIITVDNGVKAHEAIALANKHNIDVIVTDHHAIDSELPDAYAVLHTKNSPNYPFKEISGGVVAYKLATALLGGHDKYLYCLAAITTLSDMMPLMDENKTMVLRALEHMDEYDYPQLRALLSNNQKYNTTSLGFNLIPKINAVGRLCHVVPPSRLIPYFLRGANEDLIRTLSLKADEINTERKNLTSTIYNEVLQNYNEQKKFLFCYEQTIHEGLIGLVAGKFSQKYNLPSFVMSFNEEHGVYKGSARSIQGLSLLHIFEHVSDLLVGYGGHDLAGGFSVKPSDLELLEQRIEHYILEHIQSIDSGFKSCLEVTFDDLSIENVKGLSILEPYGQGNEEVLFCLKDLFIRQATVLSNGKHIKFSVEMNNRTLDLLCFNCNDKIHEYTKLIKLNVVGKTSISQYRGVDQLSFIIEDFI